VSITFVLIYLALGAFVGFMAGLLGIGGGGILVPVLTAVFLAQGFPMTQVVHLALGTSMACIMITSFSSLRAHHARGGVIWELVWLMAPAVMLGTFAATFLAAQLSGKALAWFFSVFMAYVASQMFRTQPVQAGSAEASKFEFSCVGALIGAVSALVSIGGGSLTVPYLNWRRLDMRKAIGTSAALGFPIAVTGTLGYVVNGLQSSTALAHTLGFVYWPAVLLVMVPSYFTAKLGASAAHTLPIKTLKRIFGVLLLLLSIKMLISVYS
jgi:uncharacterized membrane protein YfcA